MHISNRTHVQNVQISVLETIKIQINYRGFEFPLISHQFKPFQPIEQISKEYSWLYKYLVFYDNLCYQPDTTKYWRFYINNRMVWLVCGRLTGVQVFPCILYGKY